MKLNQGQRQNDETCVPRCVACLWRSQRLQRNDFVTECHSELAELKWHKNGPGIARGMGTQICRCPEVVPEAERAASSLIHTSRETGSPEEGRRYFNHFTPPASWDAETTDVVVVVKNSGNQLPAARQLAAVSKCVRNQTEQTTSEASQLPCVRTQSRGHFKNVANVQNFGNNGVRARKARAHSTTAPHSLKQRAQSASAAHLTVMKNKEPQRRAKVQTRGQS
eukprot:6214370-Pleurochrysis_carterae.AAC.1